MADETREFSFVNRWRHRDKLVLRVWPQFKEGQLLVVQQKEIPIHAFSISKEGLLRAVHYVGGEVERGGKPRYFELTDADAEIVAAAADAGTRLDLKRAVVHAPGTLDERVKKECWLEIPFTAYRDAPRRTRNTASFSIDKCVPALRNIYGSDLKSDLKEAGYEFGKVIVIETQDDLDEDIICREVVTNNAIVVFLRASAEGIRGRRIRKLIERAKYWVVSGRRPDEDGGLFRGYQFCDRFVRWNHSFAPGEREVWMKGMLDRAHEATREKGRKARRVYFTDKVINRFAEKIGLPRQRVASRFLDDGVIDWMLRSVDQIKPILMRETSVLLSGRVSDAVNAIEFYYRGIGGLRTVDPYAGGAK